MTAAIIYLKYPITWIMFAFGALIGSFLNVVIFRVPEGSFFKHTRSRCRNCGAKVPFYLNVPIFSFIFLKGRTACCGKALSWQYPIVEFVVAVSFVLIFWHFPFVSIKDGVFSTDESNFLRFFHATSFTVLMVACSAIDMRHMIIPDVISIPMICLVPLVAYLHPDLDFLSAGLGVLIGGGSLYLVAWLYWLIRREVGLGLGDVKLLAAIGGWLGYQSIIPTVFIGSILGAVWGIALILIGRQRGLKTAIPFGPFLAIGSLIHLFFSDRLREFLFYLSQS